MIMAEMSIVGMWYCPLIQICVLIFGTLISFVVAYSNGDISLYVPFISETGAYSPEKGLFSFFLIMGSFTGFFNVLVFFLMMKDYENSDGIFRIINKVTVTVGCMSMIGLFGVAAYPMTSIFWAHLLFAGIYFIGSAIYFINISVLTFKIQGKTCLFYIRATLTVAILLFLLLISILFPVALLKWNEYNDIIPALKTPNQKGFTLLILSSILEWLVVITILLYTGTILYQMRKFTLKLLVTENKAIPDDNQENINPET